MRRRRGQGQTEYIIMIGLVALVLVAAVRQFAFVVDEAIEGTGEALEHMDPRDYAFEDDGVTRKPGILIGVLKDAAGNPTSDKVFKVPIDKGNGNWAWEYHDNEAGTGAVIPRDRIQFGKKNLTGALPGP